MKNEKRFLIIIMNNWFSENGSNDEGYVQILARLSYLEKEHNNIKKQELKYELRVINNLVNLIPNDESRRIYREKVDKKLSSILSSQF